MDGLGPGAHLLLQRRLPPDAGREARLGARARRSARSGRRSGREIGPRIETVLRTGARHLGRGAAAVPRAQRLSARRPTTPSPTARCPTTTAASAACSASSPRRPSGSSASAGWRTLRELAAALAARPQPPSEVCDRDRRTLGDDPRDLPFALAYLLDEGGAARGSPAAVGLEPAAPVARARVLDLDAAGAPWPLRARAGTAREPAVVDLAARFASCRRGAVARAAAARPCCRCRSRSRARPARRASWSPASTRTVRSTTPTAASSTCVAGQIAAGARQRARLRGGAAARRGAGRARPRQDRVLLQRQPRVPHAADADARPARGALRRRPRAPPAAREQLDARPPQRAAPAEAGQHAARLLAHRGGPRAGHASSRPTSPRSPRSWPASFRSAIERAGLRFDGRLPAAAASRSTSTATCGRRSSSTCSPTRSSSRSRAAIAVAPAALDGDAAVLAVRDTGTGIPADELPRLFERFHRVEGARGRTHEGGHRAGAGQELVQLHGGTIAVESELGAGTPSPSASRCGTRPPAGRPRARRRRRGAGSAPRRRLRRGGAALASRGATRSPRRRRRAARSAPSRHGIVRRRRQRRHARLRAAGCSSARYAGRGGRRRRRRRWRRSARGRPTSC